MINFPDTPTLAQIFTTAGSSWQWDGNKWEGATVAGGGPYLLLTGGTLTGALTVNTAANPGLRVTSSAVIGNAVTSPPSHALTINAASASPSVPAFPVSIWSASENAAGNIALLENYNATAGAVPYLIGRYARGTAAAPAAAQALDGLMSIQSAGRNSAGGWNNAAALVFGSVENFTGTAGGGRAYFQTAAVGTTTQTTRLTVTQGVVIGNPAPDPGQGGLVLNAGPNPPQAAPVPAQLWISNEGALPTLIGADQYGTSNTSFYSRRARGSAASPTAVQTGDVLFALAAQGWGATSFNGATATAALIFAANENYTDTARGSSIRFATTPNGTASNAEAMRIDHNGNVGIGTTTPRVKLEVAAASPNIALTDTAGAADRKVFDWFSSGGGLSGRVVNDAYSGATNWIAVTRGAGLAIANVGFPNGTTNNVSGAWVVISDPSVKQDVVPYARGLEAITALEPVQFRYRPQTPFNEGNEPSHVLYGLMADQVRPHVPEIVGTTTATIGKKAGVELSTLEPGNLIYALINAVKELNAKVVAMSPPPARRKAA